MSGRAAANHAFGRAANHAFGRAFGRAAAMPPYHRHATRAPPLALTPTAAPRARACSHFEELRKKGRSNDVSNAMPVVMATWHKHLKEEKEKERQRVQEVMLAESLTPACAPASARRGSGTGSASSAGGSFRRASTASLMAA